MLHLFFIWGLALLKTCDTIDVVLGRVKASCFNVLNYSLEED